MVILEGSALHPLESTMAEILQRAEEPDLTSLGGPPALLAAAGPLGQCPLMPEFLKLSIISLPSVNETARRDLTEFACRCIDAAADDFVLVETVDLLENCGPLPTELADGSFERFLVLADDRGAKALARAAALDGSLRAATTNRQRQLRLLALLLAVKADDSPLFLARAAKIIGVSYSHWREAELLNRLLDLAAVSGVRDEACFELGMASLINGLDANDRQAAEEQFTAARHWLQQSTDTRPHRPVASAYLLCLDALLAFSRGQAAEGAAGLASSFADATFQLRAWHWTDSDPPWLGARNAECACWNLLALTLKKLADSLQEVSWWEPAVVIEQHVIAAYLASRSILKRSHDGGVEALVRPRIEGTLARQAGQAYALQSWLSRNTRHEWASDAGVLSNRIETLLRGGELPPENAATALPSVAALVEQAKIPDAAKALATQAIANAFHTHLNNLSDAETQLLENCLSVVSNHGDYRNNANGRCLFDSVLVWTIRFLNNRLEMTQRDDPGVAYLFQREDGSLPREDELQADYSRFMFSVIAGTEIEISNIGGGRSDVRCTYGGERLVIEVKREQTDCALDSLERAYASQATDYQNVSIRLGFLLVLDQTRMRTDGTPHLSTLVHVSPVVRAGETVPRLLVTVIVPGRRLRPSDLTKQPTKKK